MKTFVNQWCFVSKGIVTGNYDEDFETYESLDPDSSYLSDNDYQSSSEAHSDSDNSASTSSLEVEEKPEKVRYLSILTHE